MTIVRCDLNYDTGASISPEVDVGQVEGGLIMGLGENKSFMISIQCVSSFCIYI